MRLSSVDPRGQVGTYHLRMSKRRWHEIANQHRKRLKLRYEDIAERLDVSKATVGHWFTGRTVPRLETLRRLAPMLQTTVTELIEEDPYFVTDPTERAIIDAVREVPPAYRQQAARMLQSFLKSCVDDSQQDTAP